MLADCFVPVKLVSAENVELARSMGVRWLPGLAIVDADGRQHHGWVGFMVPDDYIAELTFGRAMAAMAHKDYHAASMLFTRVTVHGSGERAPEALYWQGVNEMRRKKEPRAYDQAWKDLVSRYPDSVWRRKVDFILEEDR